MTVNWSWSMSSPDELILSVLTLRNASFAKRVLAAAAAGFTGIGIGVTDYLNARRDGFSEEQLAEYVARADLRVVELEFLRDWWAEPDTRGARLEEDLLFYLADLLGARQINVGLFEDVPDEVVDVSFKRLCDRAAGHGVRIALEFMPYSSLRTLARAREIVAGARAEVVTGKDDRLLRRANASVDLAVTDPQVEREEESENKNHKKQLVSDDFSNQIRRLPVY